MSIRDKLLSGYRYKITKFSMDGEDCPENRSYSLFTGKSGIELFLDTAGSILPDEELGDIISVEIDNFGFVKLNNVNIKKNLEES